MDLWFLYEQMKRCRLFEEAVARLWQAGLISGEMHLGTGEEAIIAGIIPQLIPGDALALDHRGSAALLLHGVDPVLMLREMLGRADGLCHGQGGHMHLYSKEHLAATSGIVGSAGPAAAGFALAAQTLRPGTIAVAFFGEGSMNQGMLMESIHLAAAWNLPVLFVCKDDNWAITTQPGSAARDNMADRVRGLGANYVQVDGLEVEQVWQAALQAIEWVRGGKGPAFLHARCIHLEAHFLGFLLLRMVRRPQKELRESLGPLFRSFARRGGGSLRERLAGAQVIISGLRETLKDPRRYASNDPVLRAQAALSSDPARLKELDRRLKEEIDAFIAAAVGEGVR
jgi:pyruvate dehydrogenase E1 component alpha subunit